MQNLQKDERQNRFIVTVLGKDKVGIIAWITGRLAEKSVNILDISQTILQGFFTMIMIVDLSRSTEPLDILTANLKREGEERGLKVTVQSEDVFSFMHRV